MISDVLSETVEGLDRYLNDHFYDTWYEGEMRKRLMKLRDEAEALRNELDTPPSASEVAKVVERNQ